MTFMSNWICKKSQSDIIGIGFQERREGGTITIFVCVSQMTHSSWLFIWFEVILGLKINLSKSKLILVERMQNLDELAFELGCKLGKLSATYLRLPLGTPYNSLAA